MKASLAVQAALAALAALGLAGCVTAGGSPAQRLFEARAAYVVAKGVAVEYAASPSADPSAVAAIVRIRNVAQPMVDYVDAYVVCRGQGAWAAVIDGEPVDCGAFDFSRQSVAGAALALRTAAAQLRAEIDRD